MEYIDKPLNTHSPHEAQATKTTWNRRQEATHTPKSHTKRWETQPMEEAQKTFIFHAWLVLRSKKGAVTKQSEIPVSLFDRKIHWECAVQFPMHGGT